MPKTSVRQEVSGESYGFGNVQVDVYQPLASCTQYEAHIYWTVSEPLTQSGVCWVEVAPVGDLGTLPSSLYWERGPSSISCLARRIEGRDPIPLHRLLVLVGLDQEMDRRTSGGGSFDLLDDPF